MTTKEPQGKAEVNTLPQKSPLNPRDPKSCLDIPEGLCCQLDFQTCWLENRYQWLWELLISIFILPNVPEKFLWHLISLGKTLFSGDKRSSVRKKLCGPVYIWSFVKTWQSCLVLVSALYTLIIWKDKKFKIYKIVLLKLPQPAKSLPCVPTLAYQSLLCLATSATVPNWWARKYKAKILWTWHCQLSTFQTDEQGSTKPRFHELDIVN